MSRELKEIDACYIMLGSLVTQFYAVMWEGESIPREGDDPTKEIPKQSVEGAA